MKFSQQPLLEFLGNLKKVSMEVAVINNNLFILICHFKEAVGGRCSVKKVLLKISQNLQKNACVWVSFLIRLQAWKPATLLKEGLQHWCFPLNFKDIFKNPFFIGHLLGLLLTLIDVRFSAMVIILKGASGWRFHMLVSEAYLGPYKASTMEFFAEIVNGFQY